MLDHKPSGTIHADAAVVDAHLWIAGSFTFPFLTQASLIYTVHANLVLSYNTLLWTYT